MTARHTHQLWPLWPDGSHPFQRLQGRDGVTPLARRCICHTYGDTFGILPLLQAVSQQLEAQSRDKGRAMKKLQRVRHRSQENPKIQHNTILFGRSWMHVAAATDTWLYTPANDPHTV